MLRFTLILLVFPHQASASGFLELSFKSAFSLKAHANISSSRNSSIVPFTVVANETVILPKIPIDFNEEKYEITLFVVNEDKPDIDNITAVTSFSPKRGILSPQTVMFPFSGIKISLACDSMWYGDKCDEFCCSQTAERVGKKCNVHGLLGCPKGMRGLDCGQKIAKKWCKCKNNGACISSFGKNLSEKVQCECPLGYTGAHCEQEMETVELLSTYGVDPKKFQIGTAKILYESVVDNEFGEVKRAHSNHRLLKLRINDD